MILLQVRLQQGLHSVPSRRFAVKTINIDCPRVVIDIVSQRLEYKLHLMLDYRRILSKYRKPHLLIVRQSVGKVSHGVDQRLLIHPFRLRILTLLGSLEIHRRSEVFQQRIEDRQQQWTWKRPYGP